jgi:hypothetical protein
MKSIFLGILSLTIIVLFYSCSVNKDPQFRIRNEGSDKINVKVQSPEDVKMSINDIEPGQTTEYTTTSEGNITATAVIQNESISFPAAKNTRYTIIISPGKPPSLQIDK